MKAGNGAVTAPLLRAILTFGYSNHKGAFPLTATLAFRMGTFGKWTPRLWDFDHQSVEMLAFRRAMATNTWLTAWTCLATPPDILTVN
jgi:hypothetical protein